MKVDWQSAKDLSNLALYEVALKGIHNGATLDIDEYLGACAALFELLARANAGKVWKEEVERRRHAA